MRCYQVYEMKNGREIRIIGNYLSALIAANEADRLCENSQDGETYHVRNAEVEEEQ